MAYEMVANLRRREPVTIEASEAALPKADEVLLDEPDTADAAGEPLLSEPVAEERRAEE
ncbi:hypothetical protein [Alkalilimnicola ehrlichii]|nr:hypothetical protein [Alkalilimnicola ehrlichii]